VEKWLAPLATEGRSSARSEVLRGVAAIRRGEVEHGNRLIGAAIDSGPPPERADALQRWGRALEAAGRTGEACVRLSESFALNPSDPLVAAKLAALQRESGNAEAALATLCAAFAAGADSPRLRLAAARARQDLGRDPEADISAGLALEPAHRGLRNLAGQRAYAKGEFLLALEHFSAAGRDFAGNLIGAARCHLKLGNVAAAAALLDEILSRAPDHKQARRMRDALPR
jgi:tetratricopeptide (TPR) repeat protein